MTNLRITVRFNEKDRAMMETLITQGRFENISQVIKAAIKRIFC